MTSTPAKGHRRWPTHSLNAVQQTFYWLTTGPDPLAVDGRLFDHLPNRSIPLNDLRETLAAPDCPLAILDPVWAHVILRSRLDGAAWTVAATGLALPMLIKLSDELTARFGDAHGVEDIHNDILRGFLDAMRTIDLDQARIISRLKWAAYRAGHQSLSDALHAPIPKAPGFGSSEPKPPSGHPDFVLARAVSAGVLTQSEAALIGDTHLGGVTLSEWAAAAGLSYAQAQKGRHRAEHRLALWLSATAEPVDESDPTPHDANERLALDTGPDAAPQSQKVAKKSWPTRSAPALKSGVMGCGEPLLAPC